MASSARQQTAATRSGCLEAAILSRRYPVWLCDIWGVVHNGMAADPGAVDALQRHRLAGGTAILITNAPRRRDRIANHLDSLLVPRDAYDEIVTSGDVTRALVSGFGDRPIHYIGPSADLSVVAGLQFNQSGLDEADAVLCTGLVDDGRYGSDDPLELIASYDPALQQMRARNLTMICANPDKVVRFGDKLIPCAGSLAARYGEMGGKVLMAGKPYEPIYGEAIRLARQCRGSDVSSNDVLAIGDGLATDAAGAGRQSLDLLFILNGIHEREFESSGEPAIRKRLADVVRSERIAGIARRLTWSGNFDD